MSQQADTFGGATKADIAKAAIIGILILVGIIVATTFTIADKSELKVVGTIDVSDYNAVILLGAGGALVYLGIVARNGNGNGGS